MDTKSLGDLTRLRARIRARVTIIVVTILAVLAIIGGGLFAIGTINTERSHEASAKIIAAKVHTVQTIAQGDHQLAQRDQAVLFAVCEAFSRRDKANAYFDSRIYAASTEYVKHSQGYREHVQPLFKLRNEVMSSLVTSDCNALMRQAMKDSSKPIADRTSPRPLAPGLNF